MLEFQSTLPQGERPWVYITPRGVLIISIHAPTRGATSFDRYSNNPVHISIHAPTRGATKNALDSYANLEQFQSTLPQGERRLQELRITTRQNFNPRSHKGSDRRFQQSSFLSLNFNPRSHKGSDLNCRGFWRESQIFQSTLPQGERRRTRCLRIYIP